MHGLVILKVLSQTVYGDYFYCLLNYLCYDQHVNSKTPSIPILFKLILLISQLFASIGHKERLCNSIFFCGFDKRHHGKSIAATFYVILVTSTVSCILYLVTCCCAATEVQPHHVFRCRLVTHWNLQHLDRTSFSALNSYLSDKQNASKASFLELCQSEKVEGLTPLSPFLTPFVKYSQKSQHHVQDWHQRSDETSLLRLKTKTEDCSPILHYLQYKRGLERAEGLPPKPSISSFSF